MAVTDTKTRQVDTEHGEGLFLRRETLEWIERRAHLSEDELVAEFPEYRDWKYGRSFPSSGQVQELSDFTFEPSGFFHIPPIADVEVITDFRNKGGVGVVRHWIDLEPSLRQRVEKSDSQQDWLREFRFEEGFAKVGWLGSCVWTETSPVEGARILSEVLEISRSDFILPSEYLSAIVSGAEAAGVLVQSGDVVDRKSLRPLDLDVFNCFQLLDDLAPLVFLHSDTSDEAQIYVLVYALAHLLVGEVGVGLARVEDVFDMEGVELWCMQVALEYLAPVSEILNCMEGDIELEIDMIALATQFRVNPFITLIRLKQLDLIDSIKYNSFFERYYKRFYDTSLYSGRFFNQERHIRGVGMPLVKAVSKCLYNREITFVEAFRELDQPHSEINRLYYAFR